MKRIFSGLIILCFTGLVLFGCGSKSKNSNVSEVIKNLKKGGVPITYEIIYTNDNDPNGNNKKSYNEKGNFADSRIEKDYSEDEPLSGSVEIFDNYDKAMERAEYLDKFASLDSFGYKVVSETALIRLSPDYKPEEVEEIARILGGDIYKNTKTDNNSKTNSNSKKESDKSTIFDDREFWTEEELEKIDALKKEEDNIKREKENIKKEIEGILNKQ